MKPCVGCGESFVATHWRKVYCTPDCRTTTRRKPPTTCRGCGVQLELSANGKSLKRWCSARCRSRASYVAGGPKREEQKAGRRQPRPCKWCGYTFSPAVPHERLCSEQCREAAAAARNGYGRNLATFTVLGKCEACGDPRRPGRGTKMHAACAAERERERVRRRSNPWADRRRDVTCGCGFVLQRTNSNIAAARREGRALRCDDCIRWSHLVGQSSVWPYGGAPVSTPLPWADCLECGAALLARNGRKFCSVACREISVRPATVVSFGDCAECGKAFCRPVAGARHCSSACAVRDARRRNKARRRSRERAAGVAVESFSLREIAERDGWRCHLCGKKVPDRPYKARDKDPTLDHLVPVSAGGEHTRRNVALAHNRCNWERRELGAAQLRLV